MDIASFVNSLSVWAIGFNWIDILITFIVVFYALEGYSLGFLASLIDFISFVLSFILGITFYKKFAAFFVNSFSISRGFANAIGFFVAASIFEIIFSVLLKGLFANLPFDAKDFKNKKFQKINKIAGIIPGALSGIIISSFILSLILALPFSVFLKKSVSGSKIGNVLAENTQGFAKSWEDIFGGAVNDTLSFLTIEPKSSESLKLNFQTLNVSVDKAAELEMFNLVNEERAKVNLNKLTFSEKLAEVGRMHCQDMFARGYFSHYTPEGLSPFDRMQQANIDFTYAGENLALAPNTDLAMKGLMQSSGHKANILSPNFGKVGIGVIDGGIYGEMFCQEFTN
jgi:uncharacterized protein YkwD